MKRLCTLALVAFVYSGSGVAAELTAEIPKDDAAFIAKAMTAAPAAIGQKATFVRVGDGYKLTPIRQGTNGWTCTVDTGAVHTRLSEIRGRSSHVRPRRYAQPS